MTTGEKAALYSVAGSGLAIIATLWFIGSTFSGGEAWQGSVIPLAAAYMAKSYAYWALVDAAPKDGDAKQGSARE